MPHALIIDDNNFNVDVLVGLLKEEGFGSIRITQPKNLKKALADISDVNIVFLDLEMPDLDGFEVLAHLRADARFQDVPIIAHTVHVSEIKETHDAGFDGFIGKPLDGDKFPRQLARILSGKGVWETT